MKKTLSLTAVLLCVCLLAGCASQQKLFEAPGAETLTVTSGATGETVDLVGEDEIRYVTDSINSLTYEKGGEVDRDGWSYNLQWIGGDGTLLQNLLLLGDGKTVVYGGYYYEGTAPSGGGIDLAFLETLFAP